MVSAMYEKFKAKDYEYYCFSGQQTEDMYVSGTNVKIFEISTNFRRYTFSYSQYNDDKSVVIETMPECKNFALDFINHYIGDLFSEKTFDHVYSCLSAKFGSKPNEGKRNYYSVLYAINDMRRLSLSKKQNTTIQFDQNIEYDIIEDYVYVDRQRPGVYCGTLVDDKIVSVACWNDYRKSFEIINGKKKDMIEIGVGTHEDYRKKGYAVANIVALAEHILSVPHIEYITYCAAGDNLNSQKTAESAGFSKISSEKYFDL